jgi:type II secretory pathway component PulJ
MTLLEVLLACALTAALIAATLGWTARQARLARALAARSEASTALRTAWLLIEEDLRHAAGDGRDEPPRVVDGRLSLRTTSAAPGEARGMEAVVWRFDAARGMLLRRRGDAEERVVTSRLRDCAFERTAGLVLVADGHAIPLEGER